mmetsp:Transcript_8322/g.12280  ORF Transcript_8322/g.12280 Transcript_8322/m.12280 type:complete len:122 (+) Transcript_8322:22-387(+)
MFTQFPFHEFFTQTKPTHLQTEIATLLQPLQSFDPGLMAFLDFSVMSNFIQEKQLEPKPIGPISREERRQKINRYLQKRQRRNFRKKISYECRKTVADKRVRVKGRFVSKSQAEALKDTQN